jgi:hypothetical protein
MNSAVKNYTDAFAPVDEVTSYCDAHGLGSAVALAASLSDRLFQPFASTAYLSRDPDTGERWVTVFVKTTKSAEAASDAYEQFIKEWVRVADPTAREKVRLSYTVE